MKSDFIGIASVLLGKTENGQVTFRMMQTHQLGVSDQNEIREKAIDVVEKEKELSRYEILEVLTSIVEVPQKKEPSDKEVKEIILGSRRIEL